MSQNVSTPGRVTANPARVTSITVDNGTRLAAEVRSVSANTLPWRELTAYF
ncbi:hypothetical protein D3C85_1899800 [compost metagenome]